MIVRRDSHRLRRAPMPIVDGWSTTVPLMRVPVGSGDLLFRMACCSLSVVDRKEIEVGVSAQDTIVGCWT